ncbi:hypothetical protein D210916BOD24_32200 [Alteromonas sp. D210916BOD_24]
MTGVLTSNSNRANLTGGSAAWTHSVLHKVKTEIKCTFNNVKVYTFTITVNALVENDIEKQNCA